MKNFIFAALVFISASFSMANAAPIEEAYLNSSDITSVKQAKTYKGTATVTEMNGKPISRTESATFICDDSNGDISGNFNIAFVHTLKLSGNVHTNATGFIKMIITKKEYSFTATFSNYSCNGQTLSFDCTATTNEGKVSKFSFTGSI